MTFKAVKWPMLHNLPTQDNEIEGKYWTFSTFFDCCKIP